MAKKEEEYSDPLENFEDEKGEKLNIPKFFRTWSYRCLWEGKNPNWLLIRPFLRIV